MEASAIFSANDVLANLGVIAAGALVAWTGSPAPDLVIGSRDRRARPARGGDGSCGSSVTRVERGSH